MVIKASLENLTNLRPDGKDFRWYLKLKCSQCGEISQKESVELKGSRSSANLVSTCKLCSRESSINILPETIQAYTSEDSERFKSIVVFDCRGYEPVDFEPLAGWSANGEESNVAFEVDLKEKEWGEWDEKAKCSVGVTELEYKFIRI